MTNKSLDKMTEQERAIYYEEHKDDPRLWQSSGRKIRARRGGPSTVFSLRLTPEELEELNRAARVGRTTVSDFIRTVALEHARAVSPR